MRLPNIFSILNSMEETINMNENKKSIRTIELFAGVGGFRIGLERASKDFKIVWSNQFEPSTKTQHASDIYCARFGFENHSNEDISTVSIDDIPNHDLLVGGFPCQDYSVASSLKNSQGIVGKKGVLWWQIYRILEEKKEKSSKYLLLENVDRLLKSPASQRGRDFALMLSSLNNLGYMVEWRVVDASLYGMPQRRKRIFILAYKKGTPIYNRLKNQKPKEFLEKLGVFAKSFPIKEIEKVFEYSLNDDLVDVSNNFNLGNSIKNPFLEAGFMIDGKYYTSKIEENYQGEFTTLGNIIEKDHSKIPKEFFINDDELEKWKYQKGAKSFERVNRTTGHKYTYSEGSMSFPDSLEKPSRTIITAEGGASASRFKHVVFVNNRYRRLIPLELERLNMFPDNHTFGASDTKRAFLMGNALVIGVVERIAKYLEEEINIA